METFLRNWRQNALDRHQYDSAIFVGDKLLALTSEDVLVTRTGYTTDIHVQTLTRMHSLSPRLILQQVITLVHYPSFLDRTSYIGSPQRDTLQHTAT